MEEVFILFLLYTTASGNRQGWWEKGKNGRKIDEDGNICEWDPLHNDIEVYKDTGSKYKPHIGVNDPVTGKFYKTAKQNRKIEY